MALSAVKKDPPKPKQAEAAPAAQAAPAPAAGKKGKAMLFASVALALVGAGAGGGAWWYLHREPANPQEKHKAEAVKPPVFAPLDTFTVNLQQEDTAQFVQVGLTLRMADEAAISDLKLRMPEVRDRILLMLSAKKAAQLLTVEGKRKLADEIRTAVNTILAPEAMTRVAAAKASERAAVAKRKPAPAEGQEAGEQGEPAEAAEAATEPAPRPAPAIVLPVTGVLFTSFIIQ